jgi:pimeloyl-ACP methyl ester carboxylesterase
MSHILLITACILIAGACSGSNPNPRINEKVDATVNSQFVEVDGVRLHYDVQGTGEALVLIHAGIAHLGMWDRQMPVFSRNFRVIRYDVRGYGQSTSVDADYKDQDDLKSLLDSLGVQRAHLVGISNGGGIAIDFALTYPDMVKKLVLVAPALRGYEGPEDPFDKEMYAQFDKAIAAGDTDRAAECEARVWVEGPKRTVEDVDPEFRKRALEMIKYTIKLGPPKGRSYMARPAAATRLDQIKSPTLLILGKEDITFMFDVAKALESGVANITRIDMAGTAHLPPMEKPDEFNQLVLDFLKQD